MIKLFLPLFQVWSLEKQLISKLYKVSSLKTNEVHDLPIDEAISEVKRRTRVRPPSELPFVTWVKTYLAKCCKRLKRDKKLEQLRHAQSRLESELDIIKVINSLRLLRNMSTLLLSPTEQKLMRLQNHRVDYSPSDESDGEKDLNFLQTVQHEQLTNREKALVTGIY